MKTILKISLLGLFFVLVLLLDVVSLHLVPDAYAQHGRRRRRARRTAIVVVSSSSKTHQAQQEAAASDQKAAAAEQEAAAAKAEAEAAKQQAAAAQAAAAAPPIPPPATGPLPVGTVVTALPAGCAATTSGGVEYYHCGSNYYRAAFQGSQLVYVTTEPP